MQNDAEEHGGPAQGVEIVVAGGGAGHARVVIQEQELGKKETGNERKWKLGA